MRCSGGCVVKQSKLKQDMVSSGVMLAFCLWLLLYAIPTQVPISAIQAALPNMLTGRTFPYLAAAMVGLASAILFFSTTVTYIKLRRQEEKVKSAPIQWRKEFRAAGVLALCLVYGVLFVRFGFIPATVFVPPCILLVLGSRNWKHYLSVYIAGAVIFLLFHFGMRVNLL